MVDIFVLKKLGRVKGWWMGGRGSSVMGNGLDRLVFLGIGF